MTSLHKPVDLVAEGQVIRGVVANIAPFGLFVEVVPGQLDGLLLFDRTPYPEIARLFRLGDAIEVIVREVDVPREVLRLELLPDSTRYVETWSRKSRHRS